MNGKQMASIIITLAILVAVGCALSIYLFFKYYEPKKPVEANPIDETSYQLTTPSHFV